jgi:hypothetical protein
VVVVGGRFAGDVGMIARGQVDPLDRPTASRTSSVRKMVARLISSRRSAASSTRSAAVKWPARAAMSSATERRGPVSR